MRRQNLKIFVPVLMLLAFLSQAIAAEPSRIISNSEDWRDVYSVMLYGNLAKKTSNFLVSDKHATLLLNSIPKENHIWVVSSKKVPFVVGYKSLLDSKGYSSEEFIYEHANIELAKILADVTNFIIIDDSYGYNAISVAPYAVLTKSYVLFADRDSIREVERFLDRRKVDKIIIYGNIDREVKNALAKYNPELINKEGDRFLNNIEIVKKYQEIRHSKQTTLTNGEFIEQEIMSGENPLIFIGTNNVPDAVRKYIQDSDIEIGVLIGNELVGTATFIRRQIGISVFVKFAQGARAPQGAISQVEALDMFYLPTYSLNLELESVKYNRATSKLEVSLKNTVPQAVYVKGTYSVTASDGTKQTVGDVDAGFIDGNELKTFTYDLDPLAEGDIYVDVFIIYGESKGSLEKEIRENIQAEAVRVLDECEIRIGDEATFNKRNSNIYVDVENIGKADCYVDMEVVDFVVAGNKLTFGMNEVASVGSNDKKSLRVGVEGIEEEDLEDNQRIKVRVFYGERENALIKTIEGTFNLILKGIDYLFYSLAIVIAVLALLTARKILKKKAR